MIFQIENKEMKYSFFAAVFMLLILTSCSNSKRGSLAQINRDLPDSIDYNTHIKPIISDRCFACHGPDKASQKAGLTLFEPEGAYAELEENPGHYAIVPGNIKESEVVTRIMTTNEDEVMPPAESNLKLNEYEKKLITKWIKQGAIYKPHWSFIPIKKPEPPIIKNEDWVSNPIDNFILSKMQSIGLHPEENASKEKLLRRVTFDLTGLPPTIQEIDNFLKDESAAAYEKVVDRLLGTISYAERMTSRWLDISRYADSHGYQNDFYRSMWPWREWVINAYHENKPFDEFLTWQIAGDLLPEATYEQKLATGFGKNHSVNQEFGILEEEFKVEYVADRTNTLGASVLGLTVECARCHDHKYDPISQKEYYQLFGFFNSVPYEGVGRLTGNAPGSSVKYPKEKLEKLRAYIAQITQDWNNTLLQRKKEIRQNPLNDIEFVSWFENYERNEGSKLLEIAANAQFSFNNLDENYKDKSGKKEGITPKPGKFVTGLFTNIGQPYSLGKFDFISENRPFSIAFWYHNTDKTRKYILSKISEPLGNGFNIEAMDGFIHINTAKSHNKHGERISSSRRILDATWTHIAITYNASGHGNGFSLYMDGNPVEFIGGKEQKLYPISEQSPLMAGYKLYKNGKHGLYGSGLDEVYLFDTELTNSAVRSYYDFNPIKALFQNNFNDLKVEEKSLLTDHFIYHEDHNSKIALRNLDAAKFKKMDVPDEGDLEVMTMAELPEANKTYVLKRGAYDAPGEEVTPNVPESILKYNEALPKNRLGLAQWLTDSNNPMTSRVAVNRYWQYIFGRGIVKTLDDFGNQGALPSHPELLDWLSATFVENGWNIKAMFKLMVMSSTYQQSSIASGGKRRIDPDNIYLARGTRYRMSVEMIRDQALASSGLLNNRIGGPSVRPYQPDNLWSAVTGGGHGPLGKYVLDVNEDLYRRSLYTFWKRTLPPPSMLSFDAATRDRCTVSRQNTNTPLQALVLLNDPQFVEAARVMAQNIMANGQPLSENIEIAFRKLTGRKPNEKELGLLVKVYDKSLTSFENEPVLADKVLSVGEYMVNDELDKLKLAAQTMTFSTILNLDETISKE